MKSSITLPTISQIEFSKRLKKNQLENTKLIKCIENYLAKKRGFVFKMPQKNSPVILLLSGGLDSIAVWFLLLKIYQLNVYPLFYFRKKRLINLLDPNFRAILYYSKLFKSKYKKNFHPVYSAKFLIPQRKITRQTLIAARSNPKFLLDHLDPTEEISLESTNLMTVMVSVAFDYAQLLSAQHNLNINTVFSAVTASDGIAIKSQTLTSSRAAMLSVCSSLNNYQLQYTSPLIEPTLKHHINKKELFTWATKNHLDLSKTWSCYQASFFSCQKCPGCLSRNHWTNLDK
jgi:7-cyano-7-deazaguanine synthase in queuosine biosynthesis